MLNDYVKLAIQHGASDLHMEPGMPIMLRVRGRLTPLGEPLSAESLRALAHEMIGPDQWSAFLARRSHDMSRTLGGVRCRIHLLATSRGVGAAVRLLLAAQASIRNLNLHPDLRHWVRPTHGLILVSGPTGSGKSSTLAALIHEINTTEARHIVTIESPIEYYFRPRRAFIRQREVGRDTPSVEQALMDALREDPDVLMVGEMRDPETIRLTLNAAETGHLVLSTVHSSNTVDALQRLIAAFPSEIQGAVAGQLADCLLAVMAQRLVYRADLGLRVPECEILRSSNPVKAHIRGREFYKIPQALETGADAGMWTFERYRRWLDQRRDWSLAGPAREKPDTEEAEPPGFASPVSPPQPPAVMAEPGAVPDTPAKAPDATPRRIEIEPDRGGLENILKDLEGP